MFKALLLVTVVLHLIATTQVSARGYRFKFQPRRRSIFDFLPRCVGTSGPIPPDVPFEAALVGRTFQNPNGCNASSITNRVLIKIEKNSIEYEQTNFPDCPFGYKLYFDRDPKRAIVEETSSVSKTERGRRSCDQVKKIKRYNVFNRGNKNLDNFCGPFLELHRNIASAAKRGEFCPDVKTDNDRLDTVLGYLESLAYILEVPLDYLNGLRPVQIFPRGNGTI